MRFVTFVADGRAQIGVRLGSEIVNLNAVHARSHDGRELAPDMLALIQGGDASLIAARAAVDAVIQAQARGERLGPPLVYPLSAVRLAAPIGNPSKVVAVGLNYWDHCRENKVPPPEKPILFAKFTSAIIGPGEAITWDPQVTQKVDYEAELAFVIGREAKAVAAQDAERYIFGYTICNDVSARDLQLSEGQWVRSKSLDTFCPLGPEIVTVDEIANPQNLAIRCLVNGKALQDSNTSEMIFPVRDLLAFISRGIRLLPGDIVSTGTPHGVGHFYKPPVYLQPGDTVVCEVEGIGRLENPIR
jgi:2-keto-4-pentenoate hydratase/2-oxohepta-3-ene-1,7-dioic acid hydratase in catechol pathway